MIEFIQALQSAKKAFPIWSKTPYEERLKILSQIQKIDAEPTSSENEYYRASGVISLILPRVLSERWFLELAMPALAAGNVLLVKPSSHDKETAEKFKGRFPEGLVNFINGSGSEIGQLMSSHPGVRAVMAVGKPSTIEAIVKAALPSQKKLQLFSGSNNSAFVLAEENIPAAVEGLIESCFSGQGKLGFNIKKIFVLESFSQKFCEEFVEALKKKNLSYPASEELKKQIREDQGKILLESPLVVLDLSHCSTLQQDEILEPIALISPVKYSHEMIKWANTGYLGQAVQIWGDVEKAKRMLDKLEVGQVWINSWIHDQKAFVSGQKQSFYGIPDRRTFGEFYSERLILVSSKSKS